MPRTPRQYEEIRNEKKKLILDTALELFANQGYASTSISKIAQKAGISKGLMYNYFESKDELLRTIMNDFIDEMIGLLDPNRDNSLDDDELSNLIDYFFELIKNRREEMKLFYQLSLQPDVMNLLTQDAMLEKSIKYKKMYVDNLMSKFPDDPVSAMINLISIFKGFALIYVFTPESYPDEILEHYKKHLKDMFVKKNKNTSDHE